MSALKRTAILTLAATGWALCGAAPLVACDIPVFRYALERWAPDAYPIVIFHREPLNIAQQEAIAYLESASTADGGEVNLALRVVDVSGKLDPPTQALWRPHAAEQLPLMVAFYPARTGGGRSAWAGPLSPANAEALVRSPARTLLVRRVLDDESGVWVLVESGAAGKDDAAAARLTQELAKMPELLAASTESLGQDAVADQPASRPAPLIDFSLLRLSRTDPAEQVLVAMLLGSEPDLADRYAAQPIVFPVFGRGRALYALVGKGINGPNIREACAYLAGMCSCEVKDQNPGTDLLIAADWDALITAGPPTAPPALPALLGSPPTQTSAPATETATTVVIDQAQTPVVVARVDDGNDAPGGTGGALLRNTLIAVVAIIVAVASLVLFISKRPARS